MTQQRAADAAGSSVGNRAPWLVRAPNRLVRRLLELGLPMGPNRPITIRGRTSGLPRTVPIAISDIGGRRYVIGAYGDVHWVRNLRAAGEATVRLGGREVNVTATELGPAAARAFYAESLPGYLGRFPRIGQALLRTLFRLVAPDLLRDPDKAAASRPVFELIEVPSAR